MVRPTPETPHTHSRLDTLHRHWIGTVDDPTLEPQGPFLRFPSAVGLSPEDAAGTSPRPMSPSPQRRRTLDWLKVQRTLLLLLVWAVAFAALWTVREVLLPFGVALLLAYVLHPGVTFLSSLKVGRFHAPRWVSTVSLFLAIALTLWTLGRVFVPQVAEEMAGLARTGKAAVGDVNAAMPALPARLNTWLDAEGIPVKFLWSKPQAGDPEDLPGVLELDLREEIEELTARLQAAAMSTAALLASQAQGFVGALLGFVFRLFLVLMLTTFMLSDVALLRRTALGLVPAAQRRAFDVLLDRMDEGLAGVVRGQITICGVNAVLTLAGMVLLNVKFAFLLSLVAGVFSLIPIFGSIASSVPIVAVALSDGLERGVLALGWIVGIHLLEANFLNPKIMGSAAKIHPLLVVLSLISGEHFFGFTGALFAVPCLSVGLTLIKFALGRAHRLDKTLTAPGEPSPVAPPT